MLNDPLADAMSLILNNETLGRSECILKPVSKILKQFIAVMKDNDYVVDFKEIEDSRGNYIKMKLNGNINKCGVIKPRYNVKNKEFEKFERRFLPAKDFGILIISTSKGIMTHYDAKSKKLGGKLLGYCY
ncbi:30S ribosomal protein S8 [Candidatus Woesearchaeota archaeon]|nr:30S ribosomal protein S8 [Candidatus Woesearchaeota archaeon]